MKKNNIKSGLCGFMAGVTAMCCVPTVAKNIETSINVAFRNIKIYADGNLVNTSDSNEAFIYNGTTYLPVRAVGEAFNKAVDWDGSTSSMYIGTKPFISAQPTVLLEDLDYFTKTAITKELDSNGKDNTGIVHNSGMGIYHGNVEYLLNGKYKKFKGTVGIAYQDRDNSFENTFKIYGDGKLLYSSPILTAGVKPISFDVDITGVLNLTIESEKFDWNTQMPYVQIYDAGFYA